MSSHETTAGSSVTVHGVAAIFGWIRRDGKLGGNFKCPRDLKLRVPRAPDATWPYGATLSGVLQVCGVLSGWSERRRVCVFPSSRRRADSAADSGIALAGGPQLTSYLKIFRAGALA